MGSSFGTIALGDASVDLVFSLQGYSLEGIEH
jgi:hypothetical protein